LPATEARRAVERVDHFLATELEARALQFALNHGWIDALAAQDRAIPELFAMAGALPRTGQLLIDLLAAENLLAVARDVVSLSDEFRSVLPHRELLEAKLWFAILVAPDVHELFDPLFTDVPRFMAGAKVFELFRYDRCMEITNANLREARRWVEYTTALTRYEAPVALEAVDLAGVQRLLDVGGNSGEFARQAVRHWPGLSVDVLDLPVVCRLGEEHIARHGDPSRVRFLPGDLRTQPMPAGYGAISFKSVLHDWPDDHARAFLAKAAASLAPGGQLLIFERAQIRVGSAHMPFSMVANLVFLPFFRAASVYVDWLGQLGFEDIEIAMLELEMDFHLIVARRPK
jgi:hypothetical protein